MGTGRSWLLHLPLNNVIQQMQVASGCFPVQGGKLGTELTWDTGASLSETVPSMGSLSHPQPSQWHAKHSPDSPCAGKEGTAAGALLLPQELGQHPESGLDLNLNSCFVCLYMRVQAPAPTPPPPPLLHGADRDPEELQLAGTWGRGARLQGRRGRDS